MKPEQNDEIINIDPRKERQDNIRINLIKNSDILMNEINEGIGNKNDIQNKNKIYENSKGKEDEGGLDYE